MLKVLLRLARSWTSASREMLKVLLRLATSWTSASREMLKKVLLRLARSWTSTSRDIMDFSTSHEVMDFYVSGNPGVSGATAPLGGSVQRRFTENDRYTTDLAGFTDAPALPKGRPATPFPLPARHRTEL